MRILFYLPVVTPWWFANIVAPLIRAATRGGEVHAMVPPLWRGTGLGADEIALAETISGVTWYLLDGPDHPRLRTCAIDEPELTALARAIDADVTLCRSADIVAPAAFPGAVRYIMEGAMPPLRVPAHWVVLAPTLFDHGIMPALAEADAAYLRAGAVAACQHEPRGTTAAERAAAFDALGLSADATVIALPLEYEHPENFFGQHNVHADNVALVEHLAARLPAGMLIAATNHPLNEAHSDNRRLHAAVAALGDRVRLVAAPDATALLARHADGMIVGNSKSYAGAAWAGTPLLRISRFETGGWLNAYADLDRFLADLRAGTARRAGDADARTWLGFHAANSLFDPADPALTAADIAGRATLAVDPARWRDGLSRIAAAPDRLAA